MNEYRQTKEYYVPKERVKRNVPRYPKSYGHDQVIEQNKDVDNIPEEIKEITLNEQMQEVAETVARTIHDVMFNEIIEIMSNYDELNWGWFVQDDAPTALLDACFDHKTEIHYEIYQLVLQKLK